MPNLTTLTTEQLYAGYREYADEVERRAELARIPEKIGELATRGREVGVAEQVMLDAVTTVNEPAV